MRKPIADWPAVLEQFKNSGLSQAQFCRDRGISVQTLGYWVKKSKSNGNGTKPREVKFIELDVAPGSASVAPLDDAGLVVELPLGVVMRFRGITR